MPLAEQHRQKLDSIVSQMEQNGEKPGDIQAVVDDFKQKYAAPTEAHTVGGFLSNLGSSAANLAGNIGHAVAHPGETIGAVANLAEGLGNEHLPGYTALKKATGATPDQLAQQNATADAFKKDLADRYGSLDNFGHTLYHDPAGVMADISTLADGAGLVAKGAGIAADAAKAGQVASMAGKAAQIARGAADATNPVGIVARGAGAVVPMAAKALNMPGAGEVAQRLYQSALKPPPGSYSLDEVRQMVKTGLDNNIPVSEAGSNKLSALVQDLNQKIKGVIGGDPSVRIDPEAVASRVDQVKPKFANQVNPEADVAALENSKAEFLRQHTTPGEVAKPTGIVDATGRPVMTAGTPGVVNPMAATAAQQIKQNTYAQLKGKSYGELRGAQIESQKALARGIKEELGTAFPEIGGLNESESKLLGLNEALERAVRRIDNKDMMGLSTPVAMGAAAAAGGGPAAIAAGVLKSVLDNPSVKSRLGIAINYAQKNKGFSKAGSITGRMENYLDALGTTHARLTAADAQ